jgi:DNA helicase-2/ATP-dependent DNA helicase PcrA
MVPLIDRMRTELNDRQFEAATTVDGPLLILAGAGSGKTRVLTYRAAYLVSDRAVSPFNILAVTFTNKAASEMKARMETLVGQAVRDMQVSTFHSFCVRILRRYGEKYGLPRDFSIYDQEDSLNLIRHCMEDLLISPKSHPPKVIREFISSAKDKLIGPDQYAESAKAYFNKVVASVYASYQRRLEVAAAFDFDDLLCKAVRLLLDHPELLEQMQNRYRYIMVDEYQDTNHVQYLLMKNLAVRDRNICVVGDDDQSIYGWRGAEIRNILEFEKDFPGCSVVKLEQNYRSTKTILKAASSVVDNNRSRKSKTLFSEGNEGDKITLLVADNDRGEAEMVADKIEGLISSDQFGRKEIAILYRTNAQSRALEETLKNRFIPYTIVGGLRFYQRKEIKDVIAYLKVMINPHDLISLRRIVNTPPRGLGKVALAKIESMAVEKKVGPIQLILDDDDYIFLKGKAKTGLRQFANILRILVAAKSEKGSVDLVEMVIKHSEILQVIDNGDAIEAESRRENLDELVAAVDEFCQRNEDATIEAFLEEVSLYTDIDQWDNSIDSVTLMTLHSAKGLEFPVVFITGLEEGLFPLAKSLESDAELEEERRLFYVGITRAEKLLFIAHAKTRRRFGDMLTLESRFISELPADVVKIEEKLFSPRAVSHRSYLSSASKETSFDSDTIDPDDTYSYLEVGRWVTHPTWGDGKIIARRGMSESTEIDVMFQYVGRKKLLAKYANLQMKA